MSTKERKRAKSANERKRAQKGAKERIVGQTQGEAQKSLRFLLIFGWGGFSQVHLEPSQLSKITDFKKYPLSIHWGQKGYLPNFYS